MINMSGYLRKIIFVPALAVFFACSGHLAICQAASGDSGKSLRVVATTFPVYLFTANICANIKNARVELLIPAVAGCPHDYAPTPRDLRKLASANIIVMNGLGLEDFLAKSIHDIAPKVPVIDAGAGIQAVKESDGHPNPHIFAAPGQAALMSANIGKGLAEHDAANGAAYENNARDYARKLENLSAELKKIGASAANKKIALEHDALVYLARDAGLDIVAMVAENPVAVQLARLEKELRQSAPALLAGDSQYSDKTIQTLARAAGLPFAKLDPCASGPEDPPLDYYEKVMLENIKTLGEYFE